MHLLISTTFCSNRNNAHFGSAGRGGRSHATSQWTRVSGHGVSVDSKLHGTTGNETSSYSEPSTSKQEVASSKKHRGDHEHAHDRELAHQIGPVATSSVKSNRFGRRPVLEEKVILRSGTNRTRAAYLYEEKIVSGGRPPVNNNYYRNRTSYQSYQQTVGIKRSRYSKLV